MATTNLPHVSVCGQALPASGYVTTGEAATRYGLCRNSIKALLRSGDLEGHETQGGHWRVSVASLLEYFDGVSREEAIEVTTDNKGVAIYARVSSEKQEQAGSLERQIDRLLEEVSKREGVAPKCLPIYKDVASSFGDREGLNKLVDAMLNGQIKRLYVEYLDRLSRIGALTSLLEHIAARCGVELVYLDVETKDPTELQYMADELIAYITVVANKVSAAKSRTVTVKHLSEDTIKALLGYRKSGLSLTAIWNKANADGLTTEKGDKLSYYMVKETLFNGKGKALALGCGESEAVSPNAELREWLKETLVEDETEGARVYSPEIMKAYAKHCKARKVTPLDAGSVGKEVNALWAGRRFKTVGKVAYRGLRLAD